MYFNNNDIPLEGMNFNFAVDSIFTIPDATGGVNPPPVSGDFDLLDGTNFLLLDGSQFLLL